MFLFLFERLLNIFQLFFLSVHVCSIYLTPFPSGSWHMYKMHLNSSVDLFPSSIAPLLLISWFLSLLKNIYLPVSHFILFIIFRFKQSIQKAQNHLKQIISKVTITKHNMALLLPDAQIFFVMRMHDRPLEKKKK